MSKDPELALFDVAIVGGGIVGAATAYKMQLKFPELSILILEKENHLADHQTGNNSGVIHSGLYYKPGSAKAETCVDGRKQLVKFSEEHGVAHDVCGKVVVATDSSELPFLDKIFQNGIDNNTEGIEKIDAKRVKEIEPYVEGVAGIWVPVTGIIDYRAATEKMVELTLSKQPKTSMKLGTEVLGFEDDGEQYHIHTSQGDFRSRRMIFCAGLHSDRMAKKDHINPDMRIVGFRGDYYDLTEKGKKKVRNLIYPVPNPAFPFLGVHFTRMVNGEVECGPNAVFTFKREGYNKTDFDLKDSFDALSYGGTWNLFRKHWKFGLDEYRRAFSKSLFLSRLQKLIPSLEMDDIKPGRSGVRAMALGADGNMIEDFKIEYRNRSIHVLNAPSPAATACLSIGDKIVEMAEAHFAL
ncbi:MAG: L-2-hydroxyglutarate oxidase [Vicingaceae bacterium]